MICHKSRLVRIVPLILLVGSVCLLFSFQLSPQLGSNNQQNLASVPSQDDLLNSEKLARSRLIESRRTVNEPGKR